MTGRAVETTRLSREAMNRASPVMTTAQMALERATPLDSGAEPAGSPAVVLGSSVVVIASSFGEVLPGSGGCCRSGRAPLERWWLRLGCDYLLTSTPKKKGVNLAVVPPSGTGVGRERGSRSQWRQTSPQLPQPI